MTPVSLAFRVKPTKNAATKYEIEQRNKPTFSDVPSWMVWVFSVRMLVISGEAISK